MVPQPGIGPGSPEWARGCKPRLSASSSTGAQKKTPNVGAVTPRKVSPVPTYFGPFGAALTPSSLSVLRQNSCDRSFTLTLLRFLCELLFYPFYISLDRCRHLLSGLLSGLYVMLQVGLVHFGKSCRFEHVFSCRLRVTRGFLSQCSLNGRNPFVADCVASGGLFCLYFALFLKSFQAIVNRCKRLTVLGKIKSKIRQPGAYIQRSNDNVPFLLEHRADAICKLHRLPSGLAFYKSRELDIGWVFLVFVGADGSQTIDQLFPLDNVRVYRRTLLVDFGASGDKFIKFLSCDH